MTLIDSVDSIVMLYSYSGFPDRKLALVEDVPSSEPSETARLEPSDPESPVSLGRKTPPVISSIVPVPASPTIKAPSPTASLQELPHSGPADTIADPSVRKPMPDDDDSQDDERRRQMRVKRNAMSGLSIVLTLMSILVAFAYACFLFLIVERLNISHTGSRSLRSWASSAATARRVRTRQTLPMVGASRADGGEHGRRCVIC